MGFAKAYLVVYNFVLVAGWGQILLLAAQSLRKCSSEFTTDLVPSWLPVGKGAVCVDHKNDWEIFRLLTFFQTAAFLEIVHAKLGLVSSSVGTVLKQVFSRVMLVWFVIFTVPEVIKDPGFTLMIFAWSITEVVRYSWYGSKDLFGSAPFVLTWLRYTLFIVLYPLGVYGENCLNLAAVKYGKGALSSLNGDSSNILTYFTNLSNYYSWTMVFFMILYIPFFPGLYLHMFAQRKKQLRPAVKTAPPPETGIQFPKSSPTERSTSVAGQAAFAMSVLGVDAQAALAVMQERNWRFGYSKHVVKNVELSCRDTKTCLAIARAGLEYVHNSFEFIRGGKTYTVAQAMKEITTSFADTMTIKGSKPKPSNPELVVKYRRKAYPAKCDLEDLKGESLLKKLNEWAATGTIEPSARDAIAEVAKHGTSWLDLSDKYFVLLGAGSAMGPYEILLQFGANIIAVDLDRDFIWKRLITLARDSCGSITFPLKKEKKQLANEEQDLYANAGCDLFNQMPEICNWLVATLPDKEFVIGGYAYLDGERHVRVSLAMDAIMAGCIERRKIKPALAFLCSPTDVFVCQKEAREAMIANAKKQPFLLRTLLGALKLVVKTACKRNALDVVTGSDGTQYAIVDGIVVPQGPNYALAKRIQHWRAMLARSQGCPVSTNIAPSTATVSVVHNKQFAAAYGGFKYFTPMEVSYQETSNSVMAALLVHDLRNPKSKAQPTTDIGNPINVFQYGSFHGGIWRGAYKIGSIGEAAAVLYYLEAFRLYVILALVALGGAGAFLARRFF